MFSKNHIIWLLICCVLLSTGIVFLKKYRPQLKTVFTISCVGSVMSELTKTFSVIQLVPSADGTMMFPYLELQHLPFHLCSIQILLIFYVRFAKEGKLKEMILAFMYPSCIIGATLALLMPSIFSRSVEVGQAFTHPLPYQYFLYHVMLILIGSYIVMSKQVEIRAKHYGSTLAILGTLGVISLYLNSMFAVPVYENGILKSVDYTTNFFFTYDLPIDITITKLWQWYLYIVVICVLAVVLIGLFYLPFILREQKKSEDNE